MEREARASDTRPDLAGDLYSCLRSRGRSSSETSVHKPVVGVGRKQNQPEKKMRRRTKGTESWIEKREKGNEAAGKIDSRQKQPHFKGRLLFRGRTFIFLKGGKEGEHTNEGIK